MITKINHVRKVVNSYKLGVMFLEKNITPESLVSILIQRDQVALFLRENVVTLEIIQEISLMDQKLRRLTQMLPTSKWDYLRDTLNPPSSHWWWWPEKEEKPPLYLLSGFTITITLGLSVEIIRRIFAGGIDSFSVLGTLIALSLTASPITKQGQEISNWILSYTKLPPRSKSNASLSAALIALTLVVLIYLALPLIAIGYNNNGYALLDKGNLAGANRSFTRAISLNPSYAVGYYNLADAYFEIGNIDQSIELYGKSLASDQDFDLAYNGLGFAFLQQGKPKQAIPVLYNGLEKAHDDFVKSSLLTNLGWAYISLDNYTEAKNVLLQSLTLEEKSASAYCALALVSSHYNEPEEEIYLLWENCLRYADSTTSRGKELSALAYSYIQNK